MSHEFLLECGVVPHVVESLAKAGGYKNVLRFNSEQFQDALDHVMNSRVCAVRNALRELDWDGEHYQTLSKDGTIADFKFIRSKAGCNNVGYSVNGIPDYIEMSAADFAAKIEAARLAALSHSDGPWVVQESETCYQGYADWTTFTVRDSRNCCLAVVGAVDRLPSPHNKANARLIAAAPELLGLLEEIARMGEETSVVPLQPSFVSVIRAAIAKVKGE